MATPKVMKLIDPHSGLMECKVCGATHIANLIGGGHYQRGSWQCLNGCELPKRTSKEPTVASVVKKLKRLQKRAAALPPDLDLGGEG